MVIPLHQIGRPRRGAALALLVLALLASCAERPERAPQEPLPRFSEIARRPRLMQAPVAEAATRPGEAARRAGGAVIHRFELPLDAPVLGLWELTDARGLDGAMVERWRANGIRVGALDQAEAGEFWQALPAGASRVPSEYVASATTLTLGAAPPLREPRAYELALPDGSVRTQQARRGSFQFAADLQPRPVGGGLDVRIAPHHHYVTPALVPRRPQEIELDGQLFEELRLSAELPPGRVLIIGLDPPEFGLGSIAGDAALSSEGTGGTGGDGGGTASRASSLISDSSTRLGDLLFSAAHTGGDAQFLMIIEPSSWLEDRRSRRREQSEAPSAESDQR